MTRGTGYLCCCSLRRYDIIYTIFLFSFYVFLRFLFSYFCCVFQSPLIRIFLQFFQTCFKLFVVIFISLFFQFHFGHLDTGFDADFSLTIFFYFHLYFPWDVELYGCSEQVGVHILFSSHVNYYKITTGRRYMWILKEHEQWFSYFLTIWA